MEEMRERQRPKGHASILAIGTANPEDYIDQADYPDYYFRLTDSSHMTELKQKFTRICNCTESLCFYLLHWHILFTYASSVS